MKIYRAAIDGADCAADFAACKNFGAQTVKIYRAAIDGADCAADFAACKNFGAGVYRFKQSKDSVI